MHIAGAVLTGGASRRMGTDKAMVPVGGVAMAARVAAALRAGGCAEVIAIGGDVVALEALGLAVVADRSPGEGPLGGIITALEYTAATTVVVACDLPYLDASTVALLIGTLHDAAANDAPVDVAMASTGRLEPLCAVWNPSALAAMQRAFVGGERAIHRALVDLRVATVVVAGSALRNVNTPAELDHDPSIASTGDHGADRVPGMSIREVSIEELETALAGGARLIDVREVDEYQAGHIGGARLVVLSTVPDSLDAFRGEPVPYVVCKSGGRSMRACEFLAAQGIDAINVAGGTMAWVASGRAVVGGDQPT